MDHNRKSSIVHHNKGNCIVNIACLLRRILSVVRVGVASTLKVQCISVILLLQTDARAFDEKSLTLSNYCPCTKKKPTGKKLVQGKFHRNYVQFYANLLTDSFVFRKIRENQ